MEYRLSRCDRSHQRNRDTCMGFSKRLWKCVSKDVFQNHRVLKETLALFSSSMHCVKHLVYICVWVYVVWDGGWPRANKWWHLQTEDEYPMSHSEQEPTLPLHVLFQWCPMTLNVDTPPFQMFLSSPTYLSRHTQESYFNSYLHFFRPSQVGT